MDKLLRAFEAAWRSENPPQLADYLPADSSERQAILPELVLLDLKFRLKRGEAARVDTYLAGYPELTTKRQTVLELLVTEFELRKRLDFEVRAEDYVTRFPEDAADLPEHFHKVLAERYRDGAASTMRMASPDSIRKDSPRLPGCEVQRELGRGGMGIVYLARQPALERLVAVKVLRSIARADRQECLRFIREIQAAARLRHPHIVQLYEVGEVEGQPYCLLEYLEGGSLAERLQLMLPRGKEAAAIVETMARAMQFAHEQGIVHRDLKPANILLSEPARKVEPGEGTPTEFLTPGTIVKIADFGLAKRLEEDDGHTQTGVILGTASYMSPEQAAGKPGDTGPGTDVYALGAILYELPIGRPPFQGTTALSILEQVKNHDTVPPSRLQPKAPRDLETICLKCLEKEPRRRYSTALELAEDLERFGAGKHILARPTPWWEKTVKWSRRQPLAAGILLALLVSIGLGFAGISWQWYRAEDRAREALAERAAKEVQRKEIVYRFYFNQIARAQQAWFSNRPLEAARLVEQCREATPELCAWEWDYLARQCRPGGLRLSGHELEVHGLGVTPDGRWIKSGDGTWMGDTPGGHLTIWDSHTGQAIREFAEVGNGVKDLSLGPSGEQIAVACADGEIRVWDLKGSATPVQVLSGRGASVVHAVAYAPRGDRVAAACFDGSIQIWDPTTGEFIERLPIHRGNASGVAYSPDGNWLATTGRDGVLYIRNASTLAEEKRFTITANATALTFSPDSRYVALGSYAGQVHVWELHTNPPNAWVYSADASYVRSVHFSPDCRCMAICFHGGPPRVVEIGTGKVIAEFRGHERGAMRAAFSPDGRRVFTSGADGVVRDWDLADTREPNEFYAHAGFVKEIAFSPDGLYLAITGGRNPAIRIRPDQKTLVRRRLDGREAPLVCKGHTDWLTCVAYRQDGQQMASGAEDKTVILWNAKTGALEHRLESHQGAVTDVDYGFGGHSLISASEDGVLRGWNADTGELLHELKAHDGSIVAAACSRVRPLAVSGGVDQQICVWDMAAGKCLAKVRSASNLAVTGVVFSSDGSLLACAFADWTIRLFDIDLDGTPRERSGSRRMAVQFAADETRSAKLKTGPQRVSLAFSKDGRRLVSAALKCPVQMWDVGSVQEAFVFPHSTSYFLSAAFSPNGEQLAASYSDNVIMWNSSPRMEGGATFATPDPKVTRDWHKEQVDAAVRTENWFGVVFHERRYLALDPTQSSEWYRLAAAYLAQGDLVSHARTCAEMLKQFASSTDATTAVRTGYVCVIDPEAGGNKSLLAELVPRGAMVPNSTRRAYGAALFRSGDASGALQEFEAAASKFAPRAWDWLFLAMIHHKLGDSPKAREYYNRAVEQMSAVNPYYDWRERHEVKTLQGEAARVLQIMTGCRAENSRSESSHTNALNCGWQAAFVPDVGGTLVAVHVVPASLTFFDCLANASHMIWFLIFFSEKTSPLKKSSNLWPIRVLVPDSTDGKGFGRRVGSLETFSG